MIRPKRTMQQELRDHHQEYRRRFVYIVAFRRMMKSIHTKRRGVD